MAGKKVIAKIAKPMGDWVPVFRQIAGMELTQDISATQLANALGLAPIATSGNYNDLSNVPAQIQSDWTNTDVNSAAFILNKPSLGNYQLIARMSSSINAASPSIHTNYPSVKAVIDYSLAKSGGVATGAIIGAKNLNQPTVSQFRNGRFVEGQNVPSDIHEGEVVFLYVRE